MASSMLKLFSTKKNKNKSKKKRKEKKGNRSASTFNVPLDPEKNMEDEGDLDWKEESFGNDTLDVSTSSDQTDFKSGGSLDDSVFKSRGDDWRDDSLLDQSTGSSLLNSSEKIEMEESKENEAEENEEEKQNFRDVAPMPNISVNDIIKDNATPDDEDHISKHDHKCEQEADGKSHKETESKPVTINKDEGRDDTKAKDENDKDANKEFQRENSIPESNVNFPKNDSSDVKTSADSEEHSQLDIPCIKTEKDEISQKIRQQTEELPSETEENSNSLQEMKQDISESSAQADFEKEDVLKNEDETKNSINDPNDVSCETNITTETLDSENESKPEISNRRSEFVGEKEGISQENKSTKESPKELQDNSDLLQEENVVQSSCSPGREKEHLERDTCLHQDNMQENSSEEKESSMQNKHREVQQTDEKTDFTEEITNIKDVKTKNVLQQVDNDHSSNEETFKVDNEHETEEKEPTVAPETMEEVDVTQDTTKQDLAFEKVNENTISETANAMEVKKESERHTSLDADYTTQSKNQIMRDQEVKGLDTVEERTDMDKEEISSELEQTQGTKEAEVVGCGKDKCEDSLAIKETLNHEDIEKKEEALKDEAVVTDVVGEGTDKLREDQEITAFIETVDGQSIVDNEEQKFLQEKKDVDQKDKSNKTVDQPDIEEESGVKESSQNTKTLETDTEQQNSHDPVVKVTGEGLELSNDEKSITIGEDTTDKIQGLECPYKEDNQELQQKQETKQLPEKSDDTKDEKQMFLAASQDPSNGTQNDTKTEMKSSDTSKDKSMFYIPSDDDDDNSENKEIQKNGQEKQEENQDKNANKKEIKVGATSTLIKKFEKKGKIEEIIEARKRTGSAKDDPDGQEDDPEVTELHEKVMDFDVKQVLTLLEKKDHLALIKTQKFRRTALHEMVITYNDLHPLDKEDVMDDFEKILQILLSKGVDINDYDNRGRTCLQYAAEATERSGILRLLVSKGAMVNLHCADKFRQTPLHIAVKAGCVYNVETLLNIGADVGDEDIRGQTPLHVAVKGKKHSEIIELLLKNGASVKCKDKGGQTALHVAAKAGRQGAAQMLLLSGAEVEARDNSGQTPLHLAAAHDTTGTVAELLLKEYNADVNAIDDIYMETALHKALKFERLENFKAIIQNISVDVNILDNLQETALHKAATMRNLYVWKQLIMVGGDMEARNEAGYSPKQKVIKANNTMALNIMKQYQILDVGNIEST